MSAFFSIFMSIIDNQLVYKTIDCHRVNVQIFKNSHIIIKSQSKLTETLLLHQLLFSLQCVTKHLKKKQQMGECVSFDLQFKKRKSHTMVVGHDGRSMRQCLTLYTQSESREHARSEASLQKPQDLPLVTLVLLPGYYEFHILHSNIPAGDQFLRHVSPWVAFYMQNIATIYAKF